MFDIDNLGERLRQERERQGLTIDDVAKKTYIRRRYLEAVEAGDYSIMPGEVYLKGFLRSYAEALGLNGWDFIEEFNRQKGSTPPGTESLEKSKEKEAPEAATSKSPKTDRKKTEMVQNPIMLPAKERYLQNKSRQDRRIFTLVVVVLLAVGGYFFLAPGGVEAPGTGNVIQGPQNNPVVGLDHELDAVEPSEDSEPQVQEPASQTEVVPEHQTEAILESEAALKSTPDPEAVSLVLEETGQILGSIAKPELAEVKVEIQAVEDCWLEVYIDGTLQYTGVLKKDTTRLVLAEQKAQMRFGNPDGVLVTHNSQDVELGSEVQTRVFTAYTNYVIEDLRRQEVNVATPAEQDVELQTSPDNVPEEEGIELVSEN